MPEYKLSFITPAGKVLEQDVESTLATGFEGQFQILANHAPIIAELVKGIVKIKVKSQEMLFAVSSGVLEVAADHQVTILAYHAEKAQSLEEAQQKLNSFEKK